MWQAGNSGANILPCEKWISPASNSSMATDATNIGSGASRSSRRQSEVSIVKHPPRDDRIGKNRRILDGLSDSIKPEIGYLRARLFKTRFRR